jgi:hypothetical protein
MREEKEHTMMTPTPAEENRITRRDVAPVHPLHNTDGDVWEAFSACDVDVYTATDQEVGPYIHIETGIDCDCGSGDNHVAPQVIRVTPDHAAALAARIIAAVAATERIDA